MTPKKELIIWTKITLFLLVFLVFFSLGYYEASAKLTHKYQDIEPTITIQVDYDTYRCQLESRTND